MRPAIFLLLLLLSAPVLAAINPAEFQRNAPEQLQLRELSRIVDQSPPGPAQRRRVTIVAEVAAARAQTQPRVGQLIVIDYTVDLTARAAAGRRHAELNGQRPGPQFMYEPDPPVLDEAGLFWANLARAGGRHGNVNRHAGAVVFDGSYIASENVFVPVSGQYSFDPPPG